MAEYFSCKLCGSYTTHGSLALKACRVCMAQMDDEGRFNEAIAEAEPLVQPVADPLQSGENGYGGYSFEELMDSVITLECGCNVEPDGTCPCGNESPLLKMGLI